MTAFKLALAREAHAPKPSRTGANSFLPGAKDALALRLTGRAVTDPVTATTTGLMDLRRRGAGACLSPGARALDAAQASRDPPGRLAMIGEVSPGSRRRARPRPIDADPRHQRLRRRRRDHARLPLPRRGRHQPLSRHQRLGRARRPGPRSRAEPGRLPARPSSPMACSSKSRRSSRRGPPATGCAIVLGIPDRGARRAAGRGRPRTRRTSSSCPTSPASVSRSSIRTCAAPLSASTPAHRRAGPLLRGPRRRRPRHPRQPRGARPERHRPHPPRRRRRDQRRLAADARRPPRPSGLGAARPRERHGHGRLPDRRRGAGAAGSGWVR